MTTPHVRSRGRGRSRGRRAPAEPSGSGSGLVRGLLATVGIGGLFVLMGVRLLLGGAPAAGGGLTPFNDSATDTPGPTPTPVPRMAQPDLGPPRIALVAGHSGINPSGLPDPGAVCADGLTEVSITTAVAARVAEVLRARGYPVVVLEEYDTRLAGLRATAFVSIHIDSCEYINELATGYKVSSPLRPRGVPEEHARLSTCLSDRYASATSLDFHTDSITHDMLQYHAFGEVDPRTPAVILELGFLNLDRDLLVNGQDRVAAGILEGLSCFLEGR